MSPPTSPSPPPGQDVGALALFLQGETKPRYLAVAMITVVIYDCMLTLDKEVKYIYTTRLSVPSTIFAFCRFFTLVAFVTNATFIFWPDPPDHFCFHGLRFLAIIGVIITATVQLSLVMRVYAFWNCNRALLFTLLAFVVMSFTTSVILCAIALAGSVPVKKIAPHVPLGCYLSPPRLFWAPLIPPLVVDATILMLTLWRARWLGANSRTPIIQHLLRTGIFYFTVIFVVFTFVVTTSIASPSVITAQVAPSNMLAGLQSIMCSRLLLYIRSELREQQAPRLSRDATPRCSHSARASLSGPTARSETPSISASVPSFVELDIRPSVRHANRASGISADFSP